MWLHSASAAVAWMTSLALAPRPAHAASAPPAGTLLVFGDSLSAEFGLARGDGWVALTEARLKQKRWPVTVVNASLSGETTGGGLSRLPALLKQHQPRWVVIELGANDALRGLPVKVAGQQLGAMVQQCQQAGAQVVLVGMLAPPNLGKRYGEAFAAMFSDVAQAHRVRLVPFMLKGVADRPDAREWFQADGLHPLAKAHPTIRDTIWPTLEASLLGRQAL